MSYIGNAVGSMECADRASLLRGLKRFVVRLLALQEALPGQIIKDETLRRQFAVSVLHMYENEEALLVSLLHNAVSQALRIPESESLVLREGSLMVDFLSEYAKLAMAPQLKRVVPLVQRMMKENTSIEVDPVRLGLVPTPGEASGTTEVPTALLHAREKLAHLASAFLSAITACVGAGPRALKKVIRIVYESSESRFPGSGLRTLGGMFFLRLFCPAIVAPEVHNLATSPVPSPVRRSLILVAKLLQSLVNEGQFEKEDYMIPFNSWIQENVVIINDSFLKWVREGGRHESDESGSEDNSLSSSLSEGSSLDQICLDDSMDDSDIATILQGLKQSMKVLRAHNGEMAVTRAINNLDLRYKDIKCAIRLLYPSDTSQEDTSTSSSGSTSPNNLHSSEAVLSSSGSKIIVKERKGSFLGLIGRSRHDPTMEIYQVDLAHWKKRHTAAWLGTLEFEEELEKEYKMAFKKQNITGLKLQQVTRESLVDCGVKRLGDRKKIYNQAQSLFHARLSAFINKELQHWTPEDLAIWLGANDMCEYQEQWLKDSVSGQVLMDTFAYDSTLQTLNVKKCGHRKRLTRILRPAITVTSSPDSTSHANTSSPASSPTRSRHALPHFTSSRSLY